MNSPIVVSQKFISKVHPCHPHLSSPIKGEETRRDFPSLGGRGKGRGKLKDFVNAFVRQHTMKEDALCLNPS